MSAGATEISERLIETVRARLAADKRVRRSLPAGGRLHVDRPLPFLVVYRPPADREDAGTRTLIHGQAAYLALPAEDGHEGAAHRLLVAVVETLAERFGSFLLLELWSATDDDATSLCFDVVTPDPQRELRAIEILVEALGEIRLFDEQAHVEHIVGKSAAPSDRSPLLTAEEANRWSCFTAGLEITPVYRAAPAGPVYPEIARQLATRLGVALRRGIFDFTHEFTEVRPRTHHGLGRRAFVRAVRQVDEELTAICDEFDFLRAVTPVNVPAAWQQFREGGRACVPQFRYQHLTRDPEILLRRLYAVPLEKIEDPTLDRIYREKMREVSRQLTMLAERNTHRFLHGSLQLYGEVEDALVELAEEVLATIPSDGGDGGGWLDAETVARMAREMIDSYRDDYAELEASVEVCSDASGLMVSRNTLLVDETLRIPHGRARALLEHEVGTHILTYANGAAQPLGILRSGLAGYEELQEGLAVLAEYLVGGLTPDRLRLLAGRVIAVRRVLQGCGFVDVYEELADGHGMSSRSAFITTMRAVRGGGLTKDVIYLRGLQRLMEYVRDGGDLQPLFVGKLALQHVPFIDELLQRKVLREPRLRPHCFRESGAGGRLEAIREGCDLLEVARQECQVAS